MNLEQSESLYHANITHLQMEAQRRKQQASDDIDDEATHYLETHLGQPTGDVLNFYAAEEDKAHEEIKKETIALIEQERKRGEVIKAFDEGGKEQVKQEKILVLQASVIA